MLIVLLKSLWPGCEAYPHTQNIIGLIIYLFNQWIVITESRLRTRPKSFSQFQEPHSLGPFSLVWICMLICSLELHCVTKQTICVSDEMMAEFLSSITSSNEQSLVASV